MTREPLLFSVIIPLADGRIEELDCIRTWSEQQSFPRRRYQLILVSDGVDPELERQAASLLLPQDKLVHFSGHVTELYHAGAQAAEGELLMFTELHCRGDADCLAAMAEWFATHQEAGACVRSHHENLSLVAEMEQKVFEQQFAEWSGPNHWRMVLLRGFALRRQVYCAAGGLRGEFPSFADVHFAAQLHRLGHRIGVVENAWVTHINSTTLALLRFHAGHYARGEHRFRLSPEATEFEKYIGPSPEWSGALADRLGKPMSEAFMLLRLLAAPTADAARVWRHGWTLSHLILGKVMRAATGPRWRKAKLQLKLLCARQQFRCAGWLGSDRLTAFQTSWDLFIRQELVRLALHDPLVELCHGLEIGHKPIDTVAMHSWFDVHDLEQAHGRAFRWTKPMFRLRWHLPAGATVDVELDTGGLRSPPRAHLLGAFWNGRRIDSADIEEHGDRLRIRVQASKTTTENDMTLVCAPLIPSHHGSSDTRALGLPVFEIDCQLVSVGGQVSTPAAVSTAAHNGRAAA